MVARQVWFKLFAPLNLSDSIPRQRERSFAEWWRKVLKKVKKRMQEGGEFPNNFGGLDNLEA